MVASNVVRWLGVSRDLTVSIAPSTASIVPRTRTAADCWAKLADVADNSARPSAHNKRRVIPCIVALPQDRAGDGPADFRRIIPTPDPRQQALRAKTRAAGLEEPDLCGKT